MKKSILFTIISILFLASIFFATSGFVFLSTKKINNDYFTLNGNSIINLNYGEKYEEEGYTINLKKGYPKNVKIVNQVDYSKVGKYKIYYILDYEGFSKTQVREINIVDKEAPNIEVNCDENMYAFLNEEFDACEYVVSDNYDINISGNLKVTSNVDTSKIGDYIMTYSVTDSNNNTTNKIINVHVRNKKDLNYIVVYISKQRLEYYEKGNLVLETPVTTGRHNATPKGNFKVLKKVRNATLKGKNYTSFVKYWMAFKGSGYGIHDASWRHNFGNMNYYNNGSHGCINVPIKAVSKLFSMVDVGTPIYVKD